jgi:hypothetical protein
VAEKVRETAIEREVGDSVLYHSILRLASPHQVLRRFVRDAGSVNQALSPFGLMITVDRAARLPETTEIRSSLPASKSIQSQIAAVSSVRSLLRPHCFAELAAVGCGSPK